MVPTEETAKAGEKKQGVSAPTITLPKGGGAINGMGEKFAVNPVTGTGSMSIPIATSPGRSGFGPGLSISYDSGTGNGSFGLGWNLSTPSITRKTDKGLPKYQDADESDVFILSGLEDLVPVLIEKEGKWEREIIPPRIVGGKTYNIQRYRPRIEGLFARIERWTNQTDLTDTFWRSISKDNITTWYGKTEESCIADPSASGRIFSWLICESYDDKGNAIAYQYAKENSDNTGPSQAQAHEKNRSLETRKANRYLKYIKYGNLKSYIPILTATDAWPALPGDDKWLFEVVFDYGEHDKDNPLPRETNKKWPVRNDPFSNYRAGFEVRTYRLCQRVLMFHHFPGEQGVGQNCLVRSTDFTYSYEKDPTSTQNPIFSFLLAATQTGYKRNDGGGYLSKSLPPVEFEYTQPIINEMIHEVDPESLENLPCGLDGSNYQWADLDGEGLSGILTEQADGWFYKRNLSANHQVIDADTKAEYTAAHFGALERVDTKPNTTLAGGHAQFMDLAGDGRTDLVEMEGPVRGFYERTFDQDWEPFQPFISWPNVDTRDPNLKFIDLTGDGHADILISEDQAFIWYASLAESGYGVAQRVQQQFDEEKGPRLVFADSEQSIFLADLSGDGLTDLVRIRNGEVCYWPNLGYCRFGAKVTMDNSPWFDACDQFNPRRIRLADIDGSGTTDILYLHGQGVHIYFNQSGNSWSLRIELPALPAIDNLAVIQAMDFLGNGTACLVWSSPLPNYARCPMRYIDLMGGQKPHLLIKTVNNLGAETRVEYAASTKFYLNDKLAGKPWITKLPFPVHCVEKATVTDHWRKTSFSSTYSYHHGYFDGIEREFRGFGRVEQVDVESYGEFEQGNAASPYITNNKTLYQPPVKTVTWYHTGAFLDREKILSHFEHEYFPSWLEEKYPGKVKNPNNFQEIVLPQPDLDAQQLSAEEWREALRACKGMMLRQEVVELDIDALERPKDPEQLPVKLFSTAYHNCHVRCLQPLAGNRHAVFLVAESEAITYHYELDIREPALTKLSPDPRIAHTLNLQFDEYANVLQSVAVVYPRLGKFEDDAGLADGLTDALFLIRQVQKEETHLAYSETRYTEDFEIKPADKNTASDNHRLRLPCEVLNYELTGIKPQKTYFTLNELRVFQLSFVYQKSGTPVPDIPYHQLPNRTTPEKRLVEHARTLYFAENLVDPLPFGEHGRLGLTYESYKLALTEELLDAVFKDTAGNNKLDQPIDGVTTARTKLNDPASSGYLTGAKLATRFASIPATELTGQCWIRSGIAGFADDAAQHFYLPERYTDPFDNVTTLKYDGEYDLFIKSSTDAMGNTTAVTQFDFRVLAPREMQDINDNLSEIYFDVLGLPTAMAVKGKGTEGDHLTGFTNVLANLPLADLAKFFDQADLDEAQARTWLGHATVRHVYYFGETIKDGKITWATHPACACGIVREQHVSQLALGTQSPLQTAFEYSDGMGSVVVKKVQAEPEKPGQPLRWIANGKTILNNKGKPVKQYEPYFSSSGHKFEEPKEEGVTPVIYYDAVGRKVRTEMPDGSYSRVEFSPWHVLNFDQNDTVKKSNWYTDRNSLDPDQLLPRNPITGELLATPDQRAAWLAAQHDNTPALTILDSLGRDVISIVHNRVKDAAGALKDEKYLTFTKLDAEGKPLWIRDARNNRVMQYIKPPVPSNQVIDPISGFAPSYDIAGNLLFQHSMDAGDRWMINDAAGKPMVAWDFNDRQDEEGTVFAEHRVFFTGYDALHRPVANWLVINGGAAQMIERFEYIDTRDNIADAHIRNIRGQLHKHFDSGGLKQVERLDFKGNSLELRRQLAQAFKAPMIDWQPGSATAVLEIETFTQITEYDALNRMSRLFNWHNATPGSRVAVYEPQYSPRGVLASETLILHATKTATGYTEGPQAQRTVALQGIEYDAKGQKQRIQYGNGTVTRYHYDEETFRLQQLRTTRTGFEQPLPQAASGLKDDKVLQNLYYIYDPVGNITEIRDDAYEPVFFKNQMVEPVSRYTYDSLYRLTEASGRESATAPDPPPQITVSPEQVDFPVISGALRNYTQKYFYDAVGNFERMRHEAGAAGSWTRDYATAENSNRLMSTQRGDKIEDPIRYDYDPHGNMLNVANVAPVQYIRWDYRDMIHFLNLQGGGLAYYNYGADKQRTRKRLERGLGTVEERIDLGGLEIYRKFKNGTLVEEIESVHVFEGQQRVLLIDDVLQTDNARLKTGPLYRYQYSNHLGSAALELDDKAQIISYEEFHPYGTTAYEATRKQTEVPKRYRYTAKERDEESGFNYHGARYYAGWLGRWVGCDPIGVGDGLNIYQYTANNPVIHVDPVGTQHEAILLESPEHPSSVVEAPVPKAPTEPPVYETIVRGVGPQRNNVPKDIDSTYPKAAENRSFWSRGGAGLLLGSSATILGGAIILSSPIGWGIALAGAMLSAGGTASTLVSAVELGASYSGKTTKEQDLETNKAVGTVLSLSSPGGLVGGATGLMFGGEKGMEKGALIGGLAEGAFSLGVVCSRLRPGPGLFPEPLAEASVKEWQAMNSAQRRIYEKGQLALRQGAYGSLAHLSPMARGRELESLGLGGTLRLVNPLKIPGLLPTGLTAGARLVAPSLMDATQHLLDPHIYMYLQFQDIGVPDTHTDEKR
ncbi:SpvB/TcaC N-terminal domain-containing protein [Candidatus Nitrotoga sp. 1052]|uniref:SpvB/TcaC N-terminal domain-containing protein n=1 Tax=Candidatus Nitrotoga sp. 1052 TaxID=2886964 RepID=UPI001EF50351|nr:SpvB/TcaC N-terminal domain-containing protein [Candidatus Nitrotoga sp. 1052]CAH1073239.1 Toxin [Candidatus Nitrotoga sp. 1052]